MYSSPRLLNALGSCEFHNDSLKANRYALIQFSFQDKILFTTGWIKRRIFTFSGGLFLVIFLFPFYLLQAQFSGYTSISYGYHRNPLYNYEMDSDKVMQSYIELKHLSKFDRSQLGFYYTGGLMLFNRLGDRSYYEHSFAGSYNLKFTNEQKTEQPEIDSTENKEVYEGEITNETTPDDSTDSYLSLTAKLNGRHDKTVYKDFDNFAIEVPIDYRFIIFGNYYLRLSNDLGLRKYPNLNELSNMTELMSLAIGTRTDEGFNLKMYLDGGFKYYLETLFDTSRFESVRSYILKPVGKGKPGAKIKVPSTKIILSNPNDVKAYQVSMGTTIEKVWKNSSISLDFLYRHNFNSSTRSLAQYSGTSYLGEDIYNDYFSYGGFETAVRYKQDLPFGLESILTLRWEHKKYSSPALNLVGEQTSGYRIDMRSAGELYLQKFVDVSSRVGMGFYIAGILLRNQSNSDYNDYSLWNVTAGIAFGFY